MTKRKCVVLRVLCRRPSKRSCYLCTEGAVCAIYVNKLHDNAFFLFSVDNADFQSLQIIEYNYAVFAALFTLYICECIAMYKV